MRRLVPVLAALLAAIALALPAAASHTPPQVLGRRVITHQSPPSGTALAKWASSSQGEFVDAVADNGIRDSLRGRGADLETFGIKRFREDYVRLQVLRGTSWVTRLARESDVVREQTRAYAIIYTPAGLVCRTDPTLTDTYRVVHSVLFRRSADSAVGRRTTVSHTFTARLLAADARCPETPPPPPPPPPPAQADLEIDAQGPASLQHDQTADLDVLVTNANASAGAVTVIVNPDDDLTVVSADSRCEPLANTDPNDYVCRLGVLAAGASLNLDFDVRGDTVGAQDIRVFVNGTETTDDDQDTLTINVVASADLVLAKAAAPTLDPTDPADRYRFVFQVGNAGPDAATGVTVTDPWPAHLADPVNVTGDTGNCVFDDPTDTLTCEAGEVAVGGAGESFVVEATVLDDGTNTATVDGDQADPSLANNTASATVNL
jgi:hypothetical protein